MLGVELLEREADPLATVLVDEQDVGGVLEVGCVVPSVAAIPLVARVRELVVRGGGSARVTAERIGFPAAPDPVRRRGCGFLSSGDAEMGTMP